MALWSRARHQVALALADLTRAVADPEARQPDQDDIDAALAAAVGEMTGRLDDLADALLAAVSGTPGHPATQQVLDDARRHLLSDELVWLLDNNGFADLRLADTLQDALDRMSRLLGTTA